MLDNVGLRYPHRASGTKAPRTLRPLPLLRFAVSATGGAHLCSIQYYLRFWLSICRTSLAVSALRIMRYCPDKSISDKQENSLDKQSRITAWNAAGGVILYLSISAIIPPRRNFEICYEHCNQFVGNDACIVLQTGCTQHSTHHTANNLSHRP